MAFPGLVLVVPEFGEVADGTGRGGDDPEGAAADGENGGEGLVGFGADVGGFIDDDEAGLRVAAQGDGHGGSRDEPGAVGQEQRLVVDAVAADAEAEIGGEAGGFGEDFAGLGADGADHENEAVAMAERQIEGAQGRDGAFADLAGGQQDEPEGITAEDGFLFGIGVETEGLPGPGYGVVRRTERCLWLFGRRLRR